MIGYILTKMETLLSFTGFILIIYGRKTKLVQIEIFAFIAALTVSGIFFMAMKCLYYTVVPKVFQMHILKVFPPYFFSLTMNKCKAYCIIISCQKSVIKWSSHSTSEGKPQDTFSIKYGLILLKLLLCATK